MILLPPLLRFAIAALTSAAPQELQLPLDHRAKKSWPDPITIIIVISFHLRLLSNVRLESISHAKFRPSSEQSPELRRIRQFCLALDAFVV